MELTAEALPRDKASGIRDKEGREGMVLVGR
jgi:hypothetical protein